jgi:putative MATE family efflux protein
MMVGRLGSEAVAAVGIASRMRMLFMLVFSGMAVGNTALVARYVGARDAAAAARVAKQALTLGMLLTVGTTLVGFAFPYQLVAWMGAEEAVNALAAGYIRIVALGQFFTMVMVLGNGTLRGAGDTRTPMFTSMVINFINVLVGYVLIFGQLGLPALGVSGAAMGLVASQMVGSVLVLAVLVKGRRRVQLEWRGAWRFDWRIINRLFRLGGPATVESLLMQMSMFVYTVIVVSLGTEAFATQQIIMNVAMFVFMPGQAFSVAATTMVGQRLGAEDPPGAERSGWEAARMAALWNTSMTVVFFFFGRYAMRLYISDPEITALGGLCLRIFSLSFPLIALNQSLGGALRGAGDTRFPMLVTGASVWLIRIPLVYTLGIVLGFGLPGVWSGHGFDLIVRGLLMVFRFSRGRWKTIKV